VDRTLFQAVSNDDAPFRFVRMQVMVDREVNTIDRDSVPVMAVPRNSNHEHPPDAQCSLDLSQPSRAGGPTKSLYERIGRIGDLGSKDVKMVNARTHSTDAPADPGSCETEVLTMDNRPELICLACIVCDQIYMEPTTKKKTIKIGIQFPEPGEYRLQVYGDDQLIVERRVLLLTPEGEGSNGSQ